MPMMGSRGGGSIRGFGRFGKNLLLALIDSFNRTTSGNLGTSSDGKGLWKNVVGTWQANGSSSVSNALASGNNVAVVDLDGTNITNLQVDTGSNGGSGLSFWVTDANNYYAFYPSYTSSSATSTTCSLQQTRQGVGCAGLGFCGGCSSPFTITYYECIENRNSPNDPVVGYQVANSPNNCAPRGYASGASETLYYVTGNINQTITTTTYNSIANLRKVESGSATDLVTNTYNTNNSGFSKAQSIAISTSGSTISYTLYSAANKGGSTIGSGSNTPSSPVKGQGVGLFHGTSIVDQGSTLSNFSVTVTP
jgi:hypothetical protein